MMDQGAVPPSEDPDTQFVILVRDIIPSAGGREPPYYPFSQEIKAKLRL